MNSRYNAISKRFMAFISVAYYVVFIIFTSVIIGFDEKFNVDSKGPAMYWMKNVKDSKKICDMNIPGTHDSGTRYTQGFITGIVASCQSDSISSQLNSGIRYLDLRMDADGVIHHDFIKCYKSVFTTKKNELKFKDVLDDVEKFLEKNPSEFVMLQVKQEGSSKDSFKNSIGDILKNRARYHKNSSSVDLSKITLENVRGKFLVFTRSGGSLDGGALSYSGWKDDTSYAVAKIGNSDCLLQDRYNAKSKGEKIECIEKFYNEIWNQNLDNKFAISFNSCVGCYIPRIMSMQINSSFEKFLNENSNKKFGIVLMDFPNGNLIESIYKTNF